MISRIRYIIVADDENGNPFDLFHWARGAAEGIARAKREAVIWSEEFGKTLSNFRAVRYTAEPSPAGEKITHVTGDRETVASVAHETVAVDIVIAAASRSLATEVPSIGVFLSQGEAPAIKLTWNEARELADAIVAVTDVAEYG